MEEVQEVTAIDGAINSFFKSGTSVTRQQCDDWVLARLGTPAWPSPGQNFWSYSVLFGSDADNGRFIQFRKDTLDLALDQTRAMKLLPSVVHTRVVCHGTIGEQDPLHIYEWKIPPGELYVRARNLSIPQPDDAKMRQRNTIKDLARTFAEYWNNKGSLPFDSSSLIAQVAFNLGRLSERLPPRFTKQLQSLSPRFATALEKLPRCDRHKNLSKYTVYIDPKTGHITGILSELKSQILPFGFMLWEVDQFLGFMTVRGWRFYENEKVLRALFWGTFLEYAESCTDQDIEHIEIARQVGLFCRYGFKVEDDKPVGVVDESCHANLAYLDAFRYSNAGITRDR